MMKQLTQSQLNQRYKSEADLLKKATDWLKAQDDILLMRICDRYQKGYSDLFLCISGTFAVIELKSDGDKGSDGRAVHQKLFIKDVQRHGGYGCVAWSLGEVINLVEEVRNAKRG